MTQKAAKLVNTAPDGRLKKNSLMMEAWGRLKRNPLAMACLAYTVIIVVVALAGNLLFDYKTKVIATDYSNTFSAPNAVHWFGTDAHGRDYFARVLYGSRLSLLYGFVGTLSSMVIAFLLGSTSVLYGGRYERILTRVVDVFMTIPNILLCLAIVAGLGTGVGPILFSIAFTQGISQTRVMRSALMSVCSMEYMEAAKALGAKNSRLIFKYMLPNCISNILVQTTMGVARNTLMGATLGFLGLGAKPPMPEWGSMLNEALSLMRYYPYLVIFPGIFLVATSLAISLFGDALRDAMDPKLKGR